LQTSAVSESETAIDEVYTSNIIDRINGDVITGGLFTREKTWMKHDCRFDLYVEINNHEMEETVFHFLTQSLPNTGYGADKSVGMGGLEIEKDEKFDPAVFSVDGANARLSLSLASFDGIGDIPSHYRLKTKFGKLGGHYAVSSPTKGPANPFKKPVLMYEPGAVFYTPNHLGNKPLLKNVHADEHIRHCGIPITLPFIIKKDVHHEI
jgi:CRISPR-associated protein Csm4